MAFDDLIAAQDHKVSALVDPAGSLKCGGKPVVAFVWSALQELVQGSKAQPAMILLAAHLLEAKDVGVEPDKLRAHDGNALVQGGHTPELIVEVQ
jgi:hypothetical protein